MHQQHDLQSLLESLANAPPPPLREIGSLNPYPSVKGCVGVVEVGGRERAHVVFSLPNSGLNVSVSIHSCRPRTMYGKRAGEINLVDGSDTDLCTSGGLIVVSRPEWSDEFPIYFKLLGSPHGLIQWNTRMLVERRGTSPTWEHVLHELNSELQPLLRHGSGVYDQGIVRSSGSNLETIDPRDGTTWLMSGPRDEMQRLFDFRRAFRRLYQQQDAERARRVVGLILDSLLSSAPYHELSDAWRRELQVRQKVRPL
jgi:hypothetical protein